jgi:eukaryotic-like serine/threonine-protein kinase
LKEGATIMSGAVTLKVKEGHFKNKEVVFDAPARYLVGRAKVCHLHVPSAAVSRLHCLLDIDPPTIRIRDLGSRNGTFVNGELIGQRDPHHTVEEAAQEDHPEYPLHSGDQVELGNLVLEVGIKPRPSEEESNEPVGSVLAGSCEGQN